MSTTESSSALRSNCSGRGGSRVSTNTETFFHATKKQNHLFVCIEVRHWDVAA